MTTVRETAQISASREALWSIIGDPAMIAQWHPAIAASPVRDGVRFVELEDGGEVDEPILEHSDADYYYVYGMSRHPFELSGYTSRISVEENSEGALVTWIGEFSPNAPERADELTGIFSAVYRAGLDHVAQQFRD